MLGIKPTWTAERIELLKSGFEAGLSCREIAQDIGVSRNAVIGKISRLNLSRVRAVRRVSEPKAGRQPVVRQYRGPRAAQSKPHAPVEEVPIPTANRCTMAELGEQQCRWPIRNPGAGAFSFCGNKAVDGFSYCPGHVRLAYQPVHASRQRRAHAGKKF